MDTPEFDPDILQRARSIKLLVSDVDGVLTDGRVYLDEGTNELKSFNIKDGLGIKWLQRSGIDFAIITGRESKLVARRMAELAVTEVHQNQLDKRVCFDHLLQRLHCRPEEVAYIGDDLPDLALICTVGLGVAVADANGYVRQKADWVTPSAGGYGAVRELIELILLAQEKLLPLLRAYHS